jgi:epoxyqueuosine reductase QueG
MPDPRDLTHAVKRVALQAGADIVGIGSIDRYEHAPAEVHPRSIFSKTESVVAIGCRMLRGALKTIEEGSYWQAYNCDSYQYLNEILAPEILRKIAVFLEERGHTSVPIHNPFGPHMGRPVRPGGTAPDGHMSLRVVGVAAGLGELGLSKLLLTPQFGPRQRVFAVLTDAVLEPDPLIPPGTVCDGCRSCLRACPAEAIPQDRTAEVRIGEHVYSHGPLDVGKCVTIHQGWDPRYSPFLKEDSSRENPPPYYQFIDHRFRHHSICGARGCVRACVDHLEKTGRIEKQYHTPMIEGEQWVMDA